MIFASRKLKQRSRFRAVCHLTRSKQGISGTELGRRLDVTQTTAWNIERKLGQAMLEPDGARRLCTRVETGDAHIGGGRPGSKCRRRAGKTPFPAAVREAGCGQMIVKPGSGSEAAKMPDFNGVNTAPGNIRASIARTRRPVRPARVPRCLAGCERRFSRRHALAAIVPAHAGLAFEPRRCHIACPNRVSDMRERADVYRRLAA